MQSVTKDEVVGLVTITIEKAKKEILATMLLAEELKQPLPASYFAILNGKIKQGVNIKRLGFGTQEAYNQIEKKINIVDKQYLFRYKTDTVLYQRMILIDRTYLFTKIGEQFIFSKDKYIIKGFLEYFNKQFKKGLTL